MTKLTNALDINRREMREQLPRGSTMAYSEIDGVFAIVVPEGNVQLICTAVASPSEPKFRRKVGEYIALVRFQYREGIMLPRGTFPNAQDFLDVSGFITSWRMNEDRIVWRHIHELGWQPKAE